MTQAPPHDFHVRVPTMDDLEAVTSMIITCDIAQYGKAEYSVEVLQAAWQAPGFDLNADAWVVVGPEGQIAGYAYLLIKDAYIFIDPNTGVHPQYYGRGIGTHLLSLIEERAQQLLSPPQQEASTDHLTLRSTVSSTNEAAQRLLTRQGYKLVRHEWNMEIELREAPGVPVLPATLTLRTFIPGEDERIVFETVNEAFQEEWGYVAPTFEEWHYQTTREAFDPTLWLLVFDGEELAGVALATHAVEGIGWVDKLAVRPDWRGKGLGMALLLHTFNECYRRGIAHVALSVDAQNVTGATRLYERAGMHVAAQLDTYDKVLYAR